MHPPRHTHPAVRSIVTRAVVVVTLLLVAAAIATGCGGDDPDEAGLGGAGGGPMAWLPRDTWLVATTNVSAKAIDDGLKSLNRLPIWALAEGYLPAQNGVDLRLELLKRLALQAQGANGNNTLSKDDLEAAFGDRAGLAVFDSELSGLDGDDAPIVAWIHVDDEQLALEATEGLIDGTERKARYAGVSYYETADKDVTFAVRDELLLITTSPKRMKQLIDTRQDDSKTLADDQTAARVVEAGIGDAIAGIAIQTDPLLQAAPQLITEGARQAQRVQSSDGMTVADSGSDDRMADSASKLERVLSSSAVDALVPDWISASVTVDDVGVRMRGAWSNPRPFAKPDPGSRELVERMPADAPQVSAMVSDGSQLERVQAAWADAKDEADLDLADVFAGCAPRDAWACQLGEAAFTTLLEDESLAAAIDDADDSASVTTQSLAPLVEQSIARAAAATKPGAKPAPTPKLSSRIMEVVTSMSADLDWTPPAKLTTSMKQSGISVTPGAKGAIVVKIAPASPAGRAMRRELDPQELRTLAAIGIDVRELLSPTGLSLTPQQVDGLSVFGIPTSAPSAVVPALKGEVDTLGDDRRYADVVAAAKPPKQVGAYGWYSLASTIEEVLESMSAEQPNVTRALPSVRNNLADIPGMLTWSSRTTIDGEQVGVAEAVIPILK